ncbi:metallophosphoesterase family protein [Halobaculum sp. P14]|uniref:metallophosphoesterase family protein n=1 Tax=Halobaculum sp. P14 TaxID=3421638 RepID=UPI003EBCC769
MQLGVISDVHGNRVALEAVLDDMPPVDGVVCAGDVVGYGPWPGDCVAALRERGVPTVSGNHDRAVVAGSAPGFNGMARAGVEYARETLDEAAVEWLGGLPHRRVVGGNRVAVAHGHPAEPDRYTYPKEFTGGLVDTAADQLAVDPGGLDALILGHTHVQGHETFPEGVVLNPGSVGQPRDRDPRAAYAVLDVEDRSVTEHRVEYDVDAVAEAVDDAGLPSAIGERLFDGK